MIIEMLLDVVYFIIDKLLILNIPDLPDSVHGYIDQAFEYIVAGAGIFANYAPLDYLMTLFMIVLVVDVGILYYHFIMWVLRKIPLAGIS